MGISSLERAAFEDEGSWIDRDENSWMGVQG